jgi:hypothetical protein
VSKSGKRLWKKMWNHLTQKSFFDII